MIVVDTSGLFAAHDRDDPTYERCRRVLEEERPPFVLSPLVLAELDYLFVKRAGPPEEITFLETVAAGPYELATFDGDDVAAALPLIRRYANLRIGLADASIVVLAERYRTNRVLTLDERHFRALRTPAGDPFVVLPADA